ncbi:MAG: hypothetical protein H6779_05360 [Candidatus Nomurabacteria bacterium]|nr:MAG: hypothetical protein H6779_05360 [Candidatus Nomurabacteria bacterium]
MHIILWSISIIDLCFVLIFLGLTIYKNVILVKEKGDIEADDVRLGQFQLTFLSMIVVTTVILIVVWTCAYLAGDLNSVCDGCERYLTNVHSD